jgi:hypothetical protein
MKRYWQFVVVGFICMLAALLWARPRTAAIPHALVVTASVAAFQNHDQAAAGAVPKGKVAAKQAPADDSDQPLPGSSSSLPLLAVIGFGVLAGGITSAMRTR